MIRGRTMLEAFGPDRVRELNSLTVISYLRGVDSATVTQLSQATGLSRTSISSTVAHLEKLGWILSLPPANGNLAGRPAKRYRFASTAGLVLGVDIGANRVSALLTDLNGAELGYAEDPVSPRTPAATRVERTHGVIDEALNRAEVDAQRISVVSAGLTGPVDLEGNSPFGNTLPGWSSVNIVQDLSERYGRKVLVENDCKLALTAEAWRGQAIGVSNGAFIMAGARVGAAFMIDGVVCRGGGGAAGEVGALDILRWAKAPAIFTRHPDLPKGLPLIRAAEGVCARMRGGDREAARLVHEFAHDLAVGAAALALTVDPDVLILGGGISASADLWKDPFAEALAPLVLRMPELRVSQLGSRGVVEGAAWRGAQFLEAHSYSDYLLPAQSLTQYA